MVNNGWIIPKLYYFVWNPEIRIDISLLIPPKNTLLQFYEAMNRSKRETKLRVCNVSTSDWFEYQRGYLIHE